MIVASIPPFPDHTYREPNPSYCPPPTPPTVTSDGSSAYYYNLPSGATELKDLIIYKDMNAQIGEIFRACYRYGDAHHSPKMRDIKKIIFYANLELERLEKYP